MKGDYGDSHHGMVVSLVRWPLLPLLFYTFLLPALGAELRVSHVWGRPVAGQPSQLMLALWDGMFLISDSSSALSKTRK